MRHQSLKIWHYKKYRNGGTIWYLVLPIESDDSRSQTYRSSECSKEQNNIETAWHIMKEAKHGNSRIFATHS